MNLLDQQTNPRQKSVIDYIMFAKHLARNIKGININEAKILRLTKGKQTETVHNLITVSIKTSHTSQK